MIKSKLYRFFVGSVFRLASGLSRGIIFVNVGISLIFPGKMPMLFEEEMNSCEAKFPSEAIRRFTRPGVFHCVDLINYLRKINQKK